jgi:hypothetical protein
LGVPAYGILRNKFLTGHLCLTSVIPATQEAEIGRIMVQSHTRPKRSLQFLLKNPQKKKKKKKKRAGGVAQVIELLPNNCEVLSSKPRTAINK